MKRTLIKHASKKLLRSLVFPLLLAGPVVAWAAGACSPSIGKVTLNEYNYIDNFTEIKKIDSTTNLTGWKVTVYTDKKTTQKSLPATGTSACLGGVYQTSSFTASEIGILADVVLTDANGDVVDILRARPALPVTTTYYGAKPACAFLGASTDLQVSSSNKGADRFVDGTGDWRQTPGTGNNSLQSPCAPNLAGGNADLTITKSVTPTSVVQGNAVTFSLTVTNLGTGTASAVLVGDLLPAGLSYSSHTASVGSYTPSTGVWSAGNMVLGATATLSITASTTAIGIITNTATVNSSTFDPVIASNTASVSVTVTSPGATLNAVEVGAANGTPIHTKLGATSFSLDLLALAADGTLATSYNRTVTIELVDAGSSATCAGMTTLQSVGAYTFTGSGAGRDNGRHTHTFNYPNAAANVRVRMKDNGATPITACSTDNFAIRPRAFVLASSANADATGVSTTATPTVAAGAPFALAATAVDGAGATLVAYAGTPVVDTTQLSAHAGSMAAGTLAGTFSPAVAGVASGSAFTYGEVGYFRLAATGVYDDSFTLVDQPNGCSNDFSNTLVSGKYGCKFGTAAVSSYVGRFIPARFDTTVTQACTPGAYTYSGQPFTLVVTARNQAGGLTQNYHGTTAPVLAKAVTLSDANATGLGTFAPNSALASAFSSGVANLNPAYAYASRQTAPTAISVRAVESAGGDGVSSATGSEGAASMRSGRVQLSNAYGSERLDLPMSLRAEYWTSQGWVRNTADTCTGNMALGAANAVSIGFSSPSPAGLSTCVLDNGSPGLSGAGCGTAAMAGRQFRTGATLQQGDFNLWLNRSGLAGYLTVTAYVPVWLEFNWTGAGNADPAARATFGAFRSPLIYRRENY